LPVAIQILLGVILEDGASLEEGIEFGVRGEAEEAAQFWVAQPAGAVLFRRERLERPARHVASLTQPGGQLVGNGERHIQAQCLSRVPAGRGEKGHYHIYEPARPDAEQGGHIIDITKSSELAVSCDIGRDGIRGPEVPGLFNVSPCHRSAREQLAEHQPSGLLALCDNRMDHEHAAASTRQPAPTCWMRSINGRFA